VSDQTEANHKARDRHEPYFAEGGAPTSGFREAEFLAWRKGGTVYEGCPVLEDVHVDGFTLGKITDFEAEPCDFGDAYVVAPDNTRAGLVWRVSEDDEFFAVTPFQPARWGVWAVSFPLAMTCRENARRNLAAIVPRLRAKWEQWCTARQASAAAGSKCSAQNPG
jgi:hypothetical protein